METYKKPEELKDVSEEKLNEEYDKRCEQFEKFKEGDDENLALITKNRIDELWAEIERRKKL